MRSEWHTVAMQRGDLIRQLGALAVDAETVIMPPELDRQLAALCRAARLAFGAAAVSIAALDDSGQDDALCYLAADGAGAEAIVGTRLPLSRGLAGMVAQTGQSLAIDRPADDPRFARDVAERSGYIPSSLLLSPIITANGSVVGVLTVLDHTSGHAQAMELAAAFADAAALVLPTIANVNRLSRLALTALSDAVNHGDSDLGAALRRSLRTVPEEDSEMASVAAILATLRTLDSTARGNVHRLIVQAIELATPPRRRR